MSLWMKGTGFCPPQPLLTSLYPQVWILLITVNVSNCLFTDRVLKDAKIIEMNFAFWINS